MKKILFLILTLILLNACFDKSKEEKDMMEQLRQSPNFNPQPGKKDKGFFDRMKDYFA